MKQYWIALRNLHIYPKKRENEEMYINYKLKKQTFVYIHKKNERKKRINFRSLFHHH
jgi:hypothetical protein